MQCYLTKTQNPDNKTFVYLCNLRSLVYKFTSLYTP